MDGHQECIGTDSGNYLEIVGGELALEVRVVADGASYGENHYLDVCVVCELFVAVLFKELEGVRGAGGGLTSTTSSSIAALREY